MLTVSDVGCQLIRSHKWAVMILGMNVCMYVHACVVFAKINCVENLFNFIN